MPTYRSILLALILASCAVSLVAQTGAPATPAYGEDARMSWTFDTYTPGPCSPTGARHGGCNPGTLVRIAVTTIASGLVQPWHLTFVPGTNDLLASELPGRLRIIRDGVLDPAPVPGWPATSIRSRSLHSVVLHPRFADNRLVYLTYVKVNEAQARTPTTVAIARARFDGKALSAVEEIFEADAWGGGSSPARAEFGPDGMLYFAVGVRDSRNSSDDASDRIKAQQLDNHAGKVLRLTEDGRVPTDNPFVGKAGVKPEIYTYGHRNLQGFAWHPETREMWATEIGPMGGDELNRLIPGGNYGWPLVSLGKIYNSNLVSDQPWWRPGVEMPVMFWSPAISPSSIMIYTGDRFPLWKGHFFIGALSGQQLQRVAFNAPPPQTERRESLLVPIDARVRDVRQAPDGSVYIAVERDTQLGPGSTKLTANGSILRIAPAD
jgi:glucose/arabinose dehydrogenase